MKQIFICVANIRRIDRIMTSPILTDEEISYFWQYRSLWVKKLVKSVKSFFKGLTNGRS